MRIGYRDGFDIVARDDHARAALGELPQLNGKAIFQADAAVRRRMPGHDTRMQRDP